MVPTRGRTAGFLTHHPSWPTCMVKRISLLYILFVTFWFNIFCPCLYLYDSNRPRVESDNPQPNQVHSCTHPWVESTSWIKLAWSCVSNEGLLGHNHVELVGTDLAIFIGVCPFYHFKQLRFRHGLTQLTRHSLQVLESDVTSLVIIKQVEYFPNVGSRILVTLSRCVWISNRWMIHKESRSSNTDTSVCNDNAIKNRTR